MLSPLANSAFRRLFAARTTALLGSGLTTIALSLLAYELAGGRAGAVLGTALALKMVAYVTIAPVVGGVADRLPLRALLVSLDLARALLVVAFVAVSSATEIYLLIFALNACAAGSTPSYQAAVPGLLRDSAEYTKGLALSRVSYDLEGLLSPTLSTLALLVIGYPAFFVLNALAFLASALMIGATPLPQPARSERPVSLRFNATFGVRAYLATPRLRGLLALCGGVSMAGAMVIVNTVVLVRDRLGAGDSAVALAFAASGAGSLVAALATPRLLRRVSMRTLMCSGATLLPVAMVSGAAVDGMPALWAAWALAGIGMSWVQTPAGRVIEASCNPADRPAFFAAHFSLTHAVWLVAYLLAGWLGATAGLAAAFAVSALGALTALGCGWLLWPRVDPETLWHVHDALEHEHAHASDAHHVHVHGDPGSSDEPHSHVHRHEPFEHSHPFVIDTHHPVWPKRSR
jgi:hypothetical protein